MPDVWNDQFHLSFLTLKNGNMHFLGMEDFLNETGCGDLISSWDKKVAEIKSSALEEENVFEVVDCSAELVGNLMATMDMVEKGDITVA